MIKMEVIEVSRQVMDYLDAFKGSKPVLHEQEAMIIRGKSANRLKPEDLMTKLEELFKDLNIKEVQSSSTRASTLTQRVDEKLHKVTEVYDESNGIAGIEKLKQSFEMTGFKADYKIGELPSDIVVYVVLWLDKSGFGPMFVESMAIKLDPEE
ncbi:MAG: hypothetical protein BZ136_03160 [Methanosphaera sp. rholeuAM74]|nr:MAG: hypothetical protein BZ136_03160 [Methanosphaera sp. rholeuAM74]